MVTRSDAHAARLALETAGDAVSGRCRADLGGQRRRRAVRREPEAQGVPVERLDWRPPAERRPRRCPTCCRGRRIASANDAAVARMDAARRCSSAWRAPATRCPACTSACSCTPDRRSRGSCRRTAAGRAVGALLLRGARRGPGGGRAHGRGRRDRAGALPRARRGGADGRRGHAVDADVGRGGRDAGNRALCTFNEGLGKVLRYGATTPRCSSGCAGCREVLAPVLAAALARARRRSTCGARSPRRSRWATRATTATAPAPRCCSRAAARAAQLGAPSADAAAAARFIAGNDHFLLNLAMAAARPGRRGAGVSGSSIVTAMARNGTDFGIRVSGTGALVHRPSPDARRSLLPRATAPRTPTPTSATPRSPRPWASAASRWPRRPRSCASSAARAEDALAATTACTRSPGPRARAYRSRRSASAASRSGSTAARSAHRRAAGHQHRHRAPRARASARSAPGSCTPPAEPFVAAVRGLTRWSPPGWRPRPSRGSGRVAGGRGVASSAAYWRSAPSSSR